MVEFKFQGFRKINKANSNIKKTLEQLNRAIKDNNIESLDKTLKDISKIRITDINQSTKQGQKLTQAIRDIREIRSKAAKAELDFMRANPQLGTRYKSGSVGFSSPEAIEGMNAARMQVFNNNGYGLSRKQRLTNNINAIGRNIKNGSKIVGKNVGATGKWMWKHPVITLGGATVAIPTLYATTNGTGWTNTVMDLIGNNTRKKDGTPRFTINRDFDDMSSNAQAFLQDAIDKKVVPGKWSTPEERERYFQEHPNDTIRTGWIGRISDELREKGITQSDYKKYYDIDYGSLSDMPGGTGFGINIVPKKEGGYQRLDPITAGLYETQQSMGSFPLAYVKDGVLTDGESWDYKKADKTASYPTSLTGILRVFAGRNGTNEADSIPSIVTSNMKIPYKKRNNKK